MCCKEMGKICQLCRKRWWRSASAAANHGCMRLGCALIDSMKSIEFLYNRRWKVRCVYKTALHKYKLDIIVLFLVMAPLWCPTPLLTEKCCAFNSPLSKGLSSRNKAKNTYLVLLLSNAHYEPQ